MIDTEVPARRGRPAVVALIGLLLALTGCSSSGNGGTSSSTTAVSVVPSTSGTGGGATGSKIVINNFKFMPPSLTVNPGASVEVVNQDTTTHTVTASGSGKFNTGNVSPGSSATFTAPSQAGRYPYICSIHTFMMGTLIVR